jgi:hypothetical protein
MVEQPPPPAIQVAYHGRITETAIDERSISEMGGFESVFLDRLAKRADHLTLDSTAI